jgi:ligand-binding sensor domain-containing protein/two-component sensor histidine kinase
MKYLLANAFFIFFLNCFVNAQPIPLYFEQISVQNGLSNNKVNCIIQDKRGFIWIGTDDGLNRYDGHHFTIYRNTPGNNNTISGNIITDLLEDEQQLMWIATADGGLSRYDYRVSPQKQFKQYKHLPEDSSSIPVNIINKLLQDSYGYLWLATSGNYILRFNKKTERFDSPVKKGTKTILALSNINKNEIWAGRQGGGLLKINTQNLSFVMDKRYEDLYAKLPHVTITSLFKDSRNFIWYGSWDKVLYRYDQQLNKEQIFEKTLVKNSFNNDEITSFAEDREGNLWMGGKYNGLHIYNSDANKFYNFQKDPSREGSISSNRINCVFIDKQGIVWLGTNKGISVKSQSQQQFTQVFLPKTGSNNISINDFYRDVKNNLWVGTSEGIFVRRYGTNTFSHHPLVYKNIPLQISKFYRDSTGRLFIGTNYSLFLLNPNNFSVQLLPNTDQDGVMKQIIKSQIVSITEESINKRPALIAVPYGHYLAYYDWKTSKWISRLDSTRNIISNFNLKDNLIRKVVKSSVTGHIFMATAKEGLGIWEKNNEKQFKFFKNDPQKKASLSNNNVFDIIEDTKANLWITTYGGGLNYFNTRTKKAQHIAASNNLLEGVQTDQKGNVWMISNGNIDKYSPSLKSYSSFQLPDIKKSGGVQGYIYKDFNGQLLVAGTNYFIAFDPLSIKEYKIQASVFLTDFRIFNKSYNNLLLQQNISLPYNQNYISFEFSAPDFTSNTPILYQYKLTGLNDNWINIGKENKVSFSNLSGGTYDFRVRASNKPGVWINNGSGIQITIIPPFWERWWFYFLFAVVIACVVYAVYKYRIDVLLERQAIRNKIAQDLHDNIGSTLSSISVYSQVAKIYNQQGKELQLEQTLEKISETSVDMVSEMSDIVWTINPRNDTMAMMLQRMQSFAKPLLNAKEIVFHFDYDDSIQFLNLEMTQRKNFYLIFKEAVNNVLKYAACKNLFVNITTKHNRLQMIIQDDGVGFNLSDIEKKTAQSLSGNGLRNMLLRAKEMKGTCDFSSALAKGTTIRLRFPIT